MRDITNPFERLRLLYPFRLCELTNLSHTFPAYARTSIFLHVSPHSSPSLPLSLFLSSVLRNYFLRTWLSFSSKSSHCFVNPSPSAFDGRAFIGLYTVYVSRHSSKLVHEMTHFTETIHTLNSQWASAPDVLIQTSSDAHENVINKVQHLLMELLRIKLLGTSAQGCS